MHCSIQSSGSSSGGMRPEDHGFWSGCGLVLDKGAPRTRTIRGSLSSGCVCVCVCVWTLTLTGYEGWCTVWLWTKMIEHCDNSKGHAYTHTHTHHIGRAP